jgi:pimeloyl-ACP methyl ester carboxylesterase
VRPVIDWLVEQPDVDPGRLVLAGWSFGGFLAPRAAAFEPRLAALIADPGQWDQRDGYLARLPLTDEQKRTFPDGADESTIGQIDDLEAWLAGPQGDPMLRWLLLQRGKWVNDQPSLYRLFCDLARYTLSDVAAQISCPTLLTQAEGDPIGAGAPTLFDALTVERKALVEFTSAEGAGGHCEATARRLFHQRVYDWLDETLGAS